MITINRKNPTAGEVTSSLTNAEDGGLHFDGINGFIDIASPPDLGAKFSFEFIFKASTWTSGVIKILFDFEGSGDNRFMLRTNASGNNLRIYDGTTDVDTGVVIFDDLSVHHVVLTVDGTAAVVYDNGNQVATATISATHGLDNATDARIGSDISNRRPNGTYYRARFYNRALSGSEIKEKFENQNLKFSEMWASQTNKISAAVDKNWGTNQSDTGNDANDRATFDGAYFWGMAGYPTDISDASNVLTFSTAGASNGIFYPSVLSAGKKFRATINVGSVTGSAAYKIQYYSGSAYVDVHTLTSGVNTVEFTPSATNGTLYILATSGGAGTLALNAASTANSLVQIGCVSDYCLSEASPTASLMLADRSTNGVDGTISASGVTAIAKPIQVNAVAARIGTSAATPADGDLLVGNDLAVGGSAIGDLTVYKNATPTKILLQNSTSTNAASKGLELYLSGNNAGIHNWQNGSMNFATNNVNRLSITSAGLVSVGNVTPNKLLHLKSSDPVIRLEDSDPDGVYSEIDGAGGDLIISCDGGNGAANSDIMFKVDGSTKMNIDSAGVLNIPNLSASSDVQTDGSKNLITSSDKRLKNDLGELTAGLDIINNLQPHYFSWKSDESNTQQLGFYAQDVYEFLPEAAPREEVTNEDGSTDYKWGFNGRPIIAALVASVKELKAKVEALENA